MLPGSKIPYPNTDCNGVAHKTNRTQDPGTAHPEHCKPPWQLVRAILDRSVSQEWHQAKTEWELTKVYIKRDPPGICLCSHYPIVEHCVLTNRLNDNLATVGNCCVKRFIGLNSEGIFVGLRRIAANVKAAPNNALIEHAHKVGWIDNWQRKFALDTCRKQWLSNAQWLKRLEVNQAIVFGAIREGVLND
jgi:hypothetical protein